MTKKFLLSAILLSAGAFITAEDTKPETPNAEPKKEATAETPKADAKKETPSMKERAQNGWNNGKERAGKMWTSAKNHASDGFNGAKGYVNRGFNTVKGQMPTDVKSAVKSPKTALIVGIPAAFYGGYVYHRDFADQK